MASTQLSRRERLPPLTLPAAYFAFAHLCLATALAGVAADPAGFVGYFFHARAAAAVHLVTLGWISSSILGALPIVGAVALRAPLPVRRGDWIAFAGWCVGVSGVASHFFLQNFDAMAWAGILVLVSAAWPLGRASGAILRAPVGGAVRLHLLVAFANLFLAGGFGILLGFNKSRGFLPGFPLSDTFAHAHVAALGWATLTVIGTGYRLFPMVVPAAMPDATGSTPGLRGWRGVGSVILLEAGLAGLVVTLVAGSRLVPLAAGACLAALAVFAAWVGWMLRNLRPPPAGARRADPPLVQMAFAGACLLGASGCGAWLSFQSAQESETALSVATVYGVLGLVGFLSQLVIAMEGRLVPLVAAIRDAARAGEAGEDVSPPHERVDRRLQAVVLALWLAGVPALAWGFLATAPAFIGAGCGALLVSLPVHATALSIAIRRDDNRRT